MPLSTNLNTPPYNADYQSNSSYYDVLFQPGVSVQARELNNLQLMLQNQIEQFGDNIFSSGTIVSGCKFNPLNPYYYAQLNDLDVFNNVVVPSALPGYSAENQNGLIANILNYANGYQTTPPNLKTIYLKYVGTGPVGMNLTSFAAGDVLTIYNPVTNPIEQVNVVNGGQNFSNSDTVLAISQLICTQTLGTPLATGYLSNGNGLTNVNVISVVALTGANQYLIGISPLTADLVNSQCNSQYWTFNVDDTLANPANTINLTVNQIVGTGFQANIVTTSVGTIEAVNVANGGGGVGYIYEPTITIQTTTGITTGYNTLNLQAQNYLTEVIVASGANTIGAGYAYSFTGGVIYQKGYFLQVNPQVVIVNNFSQSPNGVSVGYQTTESLVNFNLDPSLLDNANGSPNYQAPGADRLQLIPQLVVVPTSGNNAGNSSFLPLIVFNDGLPVIQRQQTVYSTIETEIAQGIEDTSGDFVLDPFVVTTTSPSDSTKEGQYFQIVVDPGTAYINGFKVQTKTNYPVNERKGTDTVIINNHSISLDYGNYLIVNNVAGAWPFNFSANVNLYNSPKNFYSSVGQSMNANGTQIGTASMRSMLLWEGPPGTGAAQYALYLYRVMMNVGYNFANVQGVQAINSSANIGVADVVLVSNPSGNLVANLQETSIDHMVFYSGAQSLKNANNVSYEYRTVNTVAQMTNGSSAAANLTITTSGSETFPYGAGALSQLQLQDFYVVPSADIIYTANVAGNASVSAASNTVNGTSVATYSTSFSVGDWIYIVGSAGQGHTLSQITAIANATFMTVTPNAGFTNTGALIFRAFPANVPIPFGYRSNLLGNNNGTSTSLNLSLAQATNSAANVNCTIAYNVSTNNVTQLTKTAYRNYYVSFCTSNNAGGQTGPWCMGVPDVFRLRSVYMGNSTVTNTGTNYVSAFYVDPKGKADYYGLSNLYIQPGFQNTLPMTSNTYILACFDYFVSSGTAGFYDTVSYLQTSTAATIFAQDSNALSSLTTSCNSFEVPELFLDDGTEIDLLQYIDFRPYAANTVNPSQTSTGLPSLNPSSTITLSSSYDHKFPVPSTNFTATIESWEGRIDSIFLDQNANFVVANGAPSANISLALAPFQPDGTMKLVDMVIPPYPDLPTNLSVNMNQILDTNIVNNQRFKTTRIQNQTIYNLSANSSLPFNQPRVYTQAEIGQLANQIAELQYFADLSDLEANATSMLIPSSVSPSLNRTSYGIFTDNFATSDFSALTDPEYSASKQGTNIVPDLMQWDLSLYGIGTTPYIQYPIVNQNNATYTQLEPAGPICAVNLANTVAYTLLFRSNGNMPLGSSVDTISVTMADSASVYGSIASQSNTISQFILNQQYTTKNLPPVGIVSSSYIELNHWIGNVDADIVVSNWGPITSSSYNAATQSLTIVEPGYKVTIAGVPANIANLFSQAASHQITWQQYYAALNVKGAAPTGGATNNGQYNPPVAFYFYDYTQGVQYNIYQGTNLVASSNNTLSVPSCTALSNSDIALLEGSASQYWFNDNPSTYMQNFTNLGNGFVNYAGKILFNYNPANGAIFTVSTTPTNINQNWRWLLAYPIDGASVGCVPAPPQLSPIYGTYDTLSQCGNGSSASGQIKILIGFTATWNGPTNPSTAIVPFDPSQDWG